MSDNKKRLINLFSLSLSSLEREVLLLRREDWIILRKGEGNDFREVSIWSLELRLRFSGIEVFLGLRRVVLTC